MIYHALDLDRALRSELWQALSNIAGRYREDVNDFPVERTDTDGSVESAVSGFDFATPINPIEALRRVESAMRLHQTHTAHSRYFGLFNPNPTPMGIAGEALAGIFNPQLAAWSHSPFAVQMERRLVREIGMQFDQRLTTGTFTSGGAEANVTAMVCAFVRLFPNFSTLGIRGLGSQPIAYVSAAAHHSFVKAARTVGLGTRFLRVVPCDSSHAMDTLALTSMIEEDERKGFTPFFVVATAGATATGVIEPIEEIGKIASAHGAWLHVDAAWGGFAALIPELRAHLQGLERADSVTFDPHKMLSVPMGAGMFLTADSESLEKAFSVVADYMPAQESAGDRVDPFTHSMQWSRRFIGLKVLLSLAVAGWDGYAQVLRRQVEVGHYLRSQVQATGFSVVNDTPFPVVCGVPGIAGVSVGEIVRRIVATGNAWVSHAALPDGAPVVRACVTNYLTTEADVDALRVELQRAMVP